MDKNIDKKSDEKCCFEKRTSRFAKKKEWNKHGIKCNALLHAYCKIGFEYDDLNIFLSKVQQIGIGLVA